MGKRILLCFVIGGTTIISGCATAGKIKKLPRIEKSEGIKSEEIKSEEIKPKLIIPRYGMPVVAIKEYIYILGGSTQKGFVGDIEKFSTKTGKITLMKTKLYPRRYHTAEVHNGKIYITGGYGEKGLVSLLEIYDPKNDSISEGIPLPTPRYFASSVMVDGKMYVVGGSKLGRGAPFSSALEIYDVKKNTWTEGAPMLLARQTDVVEKDGLIYAVGGYNGNAVKKFGAYDIKKDKWITLSDLPFPISANHCSVLQNRYIDRIYSFGDYYELDRVWVYDFDVEEWDVVKNCPGQIYLPSRHNAVVSVADTIYVIGGNVSTRGSHLDTIQSITYENLLKAGRK